MLEQNTSQLIANHHVRIQRSHWILEYHRDATRTITIQYIGCCTQELLAIEANASAGYCIGRQQTHHRHGCLRLTGARLTDNAE